MSKVVTFFAAALAFGLGQTVRWVYRYNGSGNQTDWAKSVVVGADGNIYAAGTSFDKDTSFDFTVVSLTPDGTERWVYRHEPRGFEEAYSVVQGSDGNIYAGGTGSATVVGLTPDGVERWVYPCSGSAPGAAYSIVYGSDGNIYYAGDGFSQSGYINIVVVGLTPDGRERWVYIYDDPQWHWVDKARSLVYGLDGNLYLAGSSFYTDSSAQVVISLTPNGRERWAYRYCSESGNPENEAYSIIYGADSNLYVAGYSGRLGWSDATVLSLTTQGTERWVCRACPGSAYSVAYGGDGFVYAAGIAWDFLVFSLDPTTGIHEASRPAENQKLSLAVHPNPARGIVRVNYNTPGSATLGVFDALGRAVYSVTDNSGFFVLDNLPVGVYTLQLEAAGRKEARRLVVVR